MLAVSGGRCRGAAAPGGLAVCDDLRRRCVRDLAEGFNVARRGHFAGDAVVDEETAGATYTRQMRACVHRVESALSRDLADCLKMVARRFGQAARPLTEVIESPDLTHFDGKWALSLYDLHVM
jgi:hypothetical protein